MDYLFYDVQFYFCSMDLNEYDFQDEFSSYDEILDFEDAGDVDVETFQKPDSEDDPFYRSLDEY